MLRRRPDSTYEFRQIEAALRSARPKPLSAERKEALRLRIMSRLGEQELARPGLRVLHERWITVPAGIGLAAAIFAGARIVAEEAPWSTGGSTVVAHATGSMLVDGRP